MVEQPAPLSWANAAERSVHSIPSSLPDKKGGFNSRKVRLSIPCFFYSRVSDLMPVAVGAFGSLRSFG